MRPITLPWTTTHWLRLIHEGDAHGSYVFWDESWKFLGWYINFQEPFRRNPLGIDTMDQTLDLELAPDRGRWRWKDEAEFPAGIEYGWYTEAMLDDVKACGMRVLELAQAGEPPFGDGWEHWRPDPAWGPVELVDGGDVILEES